MFKSVLSMIAFILLIFISLSDAYYATNCQEDHTKVSISHALPFVEDLIAPREQRITAVQCLSHYGTEGARLLFTVLERESDNFDVTGYVLSSLGYIQERSVITTLLPLIGEESANRDKARSDAVFVKRKPWLKVQVIDVLGKLALSAFDEPNSPGPRTIILCGSGSNIFHSRGIRPKRSDAIKVMVLLRTITASQQPSMTKGEALIVESAASGLKRIEERIALLRKYGPRKKYGPMK